MKEECLAWNEHRDQHVLELLRMEGFCLGCLPLIGPPPEAPLDFTVFLTKLEGISNLVVAAPAWTLEKVFELFVGLPRRRVAHGQTVQVVESFVPAAENWFRFQSEIVHMAGVAHEPPYFRAAGDGRWAHCTTIHIQGAGTDSKLRVIHIGLGPSRDQVFLHFLAPHGLVPKRLLL